MKPSEHLFLSITYILEYNPGFYTLFTPNSTSGYQVCIEVLQHISWDTALHQKKYRTMIFAAIRHMWSFSDWKGFWGFCLYPPSR